MSKNKDFNMIMLLATTFCPFIVWNKIADNAGIIENTSPKIKGIVAAIPNTLDAAATYPLLIAGPAVTMAALGAVWYMFSTDNKGEFHGKDYKEFVRGSKIVSFKKLKKLTTEKNKKQVMIGEIPMPTEVETLHLLVTGATGTGKTTLMTPLAFSALLRGDRLAIVDPNAQFLRKFYNPDKDLILNPFDMRTEGWSFFNEIREDYDFESLACSIVPPSKDIQAEEWNQYGRLLLAETARKLYYSGNMDIATLRHITTIKEPKDVQAFLKGTPAESLFTGATKALAGARFVLSTKFPSHERMVDGSFSIRDWLNHSTGNLFITWREDQLASVMPLVQSWVDIICAYTLSLPEYPDLATWLFLDELDTLGNLRSLPPAATKGRKHGLRLAGSLQANSQLDRHYGRDTAITLRSCFRNVVALGGSASDPDTAEIQSRGFSEHEVVRERETESTTGRRSSSSSPDLVKERIILPSDIISLPNLDCFIKFAGNYPVAKHTLPIRQFADVAPAFVMR